MRGTLRRTWLALLLTAAAVIVPLTAWYVAGSRSASEEAARLRQAPVEMARREADRMASQIAGRLEALRQAESRRPHTDYGGFDPVDTADCTWEVELGSPLAQGPADPLIWAHFQIDSVGRLTLPTLHAGDPGRLPPAVEEIQSAILEELECASSTHLAALRRGETGAKRRELLARGGIVVVGPFSWHTANLGGEPALVALREVSTPQAVRTQGFVLLAGGLGSLLADPLFPVSVRAGANDGGTQATVSLDGDPWIVEVDAGEAIAAAELTATALERRFLTRFSGAALAILLAGCAVVLLVRQTELLARQRARFAAAAAHELRTPLAGLQLYGEMLAEGSGEPGRTEAYARRVAEETERLGRVVSNVLGVARLERGNLALHPESGNLTAAVRTSLDRLRPIVEARGATLELDVTDDALPAVRFDRDALHQILQNLVDNAERYSRSSTDRSITVRVAATNAGAAVSVLDRGPGLPPKIRPGKIRPFAGDGHAGPDQGLGIGLAIVDMLVEAQGASIQAGDRESGGCCVTVGFGLETEAEHR